MDKYYFVGYLGKQVEELHLSDCFNMDNIFFVSENLSDKLINHSRLLKFFWYCHQWKYIGEKEPLFKHMWNRFYNMYNIDYSEEDNHYIIFFDSAISVYYSEIFFVDFKKKHKNVKLILYVVDQMNRRYSPRIRRMFKYFDAIYGIIPDDCKDYGFEYYPLVYSRYPIDEMSREVVNDIYFMGNNSDRDEQLHALYEFFCENGLRCDFSIVAVPEEKQRYKGEIGYNKYFTMEENLEHSLASNCILEIMHKGVNAVTARYPEAIYLNKKILTNNKRVIDEKYYDERYVKIFDSFEDIDIDWIKRRDNINYNYKGDYSPLEFIKIIKKRLG